MAFSPQVTYQIDRGRLENELHRRCLAAGVHVRAARVQAVALRTPGDPAGPHRVTLRGDERTDTVTARWVLDATGRNRVLPRALNLKRTNGHDCSAAWLRVGTDIDVGRWSEDPDWQARLVEGRRGDSTTHLMGQGYWVWLIRLASGATSVGIVADPRFHAFESFNTLERARAWLAAHEPQCAAVLAAAATEIRDFRVMKHYSHTLSRAFDGAGRWAVTGDAGVFLDPLYSSGLDLVAIGNGLITDMVCRDLDGEDVTARAAVSDTLFRSLTDMWLNIYRDQYALMGTPAVMSAKIIWDIAFYWGFVGMLYTNDSFVTVADNPAFVPHLAGLIDLSNRMQTFFREWSALIDAEDRLVAAPFVDLYAPQNFMVRLHTAMMGRATDFDGQFAANARLLRQVAGQLVETVLAEQADRFGADAAMRQVQAWQQDPLLRELRAIYRTDQGADPVSDTWLRRPVAAG